MSAHCDNVPHIIYNVYTPHICFIFAQGNLYKYIYPYQISGYIGYAQHHGTDFQAIGLTQRGFKATWSDDIKIFKN